MANVYDKFGWYCSGFTSQADAEAARDDIEAWFWKTHDKGAWQIVTTVRQGPSGWKGELDASRVVNG